MKNEKKPYKRQIVNERNPLVIYKRKNAFRWNNLCDKTGLSIATLIRIALKSEDTIGYTSYNSIAKLKEFLGIDMINDWNNK